MWLLKHKGFSFSTYIKVSVSLAALTEEYSHVARSLPLQFVSSHNNLQEATYKARTGGVHGTWGFSIFQALEHFLTRTDIEKQPRSKNTFYYPVCNSSAEGKILSKDMRLGHPLQSWLFVKLFPQFFWAWRCLSLDMVNWLIVFLIST